jgi:hypothetical protein
MKQFTMTLEDSECKRKEALGDITHKKVYLAGLEKLEEQSVKVQPKAIKK